MSGYKATIKTTLDAYRKGAEKCGWCCRVCHREFMFTARWEAPLRFASVLRHRAIRHHKLGTYVDGGRCRISHVSVPEPWHQITWSVTSGQGTQFFTGLPPTPDKTP